MLHVPASTSPAAREPLASGVPRLRGPIQLGLLTTDLDSESVFATLQLAIARSSAERDVILGAIAEAAQALADATGAALAIQCDDAIICRARSGETAPGLGARLGADSGISGECLRTGRVLRCDDTANDPRVDPEVCRRLGLRSIAVVPLRGRYGPIGILEVFSMRACAFTDEHMGYLLRLAGLAEAAQERVIRRDKPVAASPEGRVPEARTKVIAPSEQVGALRRARNGLAVRLLGEEKRRYWAVSVAILLISLLAWRALRTPRSEVVPVAQSAVTTPETAAPEMVTALDLKPSPIRAGTRASAIEASRAIQPAAKIEITDLTDASQNPPAAAASQLPRPVGSDASGEIEQVPQISASDEGTSTKIDRQVASSPAEPQSGAPLSQGILQAVLQYKVQPVYPQAALQQRLQGRVVLEATIEDDGTVAGVTVLSGNAILAQAAVAAVQQWQYRPALLEGKPVRTQRQITVRFAAP